MRRYTRREVLAVAAIGAAPIKPQPKAPSIRDMISPDTLRRFGKPWIEKARVDPALRKELTAIMEEAFGKEACAELTYLFLMDKRPDLEHYPLIHRRIKAAIYRGVK